MDAKTRAELSESAKLLEELRQRLLALKADGEDGLEGLAAHALAAVTSRHFRLARAGRQHGRDGATAPGPFDIFFESKRYADQAPSTEDLQSKLMSAVNAHYPRLDLWIVVATIALGENSVADIEATADRFGITTAVFDWSLHALPPLGVLLATAREAVVEWFAARQPQADAEAIERLLRAIERHASFQAEAAELIASVTAETVGLGAARSKNHAWLAARLCDRRAARQSFGQFVAPHAHDVRTVERKPEAQRIAAAMSDMQNDIVAVTGDEGNGKTWLTVLAWESLPERPILLLCTTDSPYLEQASRDAVRFLAELLVEQTGESQDADSIERWIRRLNSWKDEQPSAPKIWLVLDGLNERENQPWIPIVLRIMAVAPQLGVRLVLTSRPAFFDARIRPSLAEYRLKVMPIGPFTDAEVVEGLKLHNVDPAGIDEKVRQFLRNPRIFSIAVSMLDRLSPNELRSERLLYEYWRRRVEERVDLRHTDAEMRRLLISHARSVRAEIAASKDVTVPSFRRELIKQHSRPAQRVSDPSIDDELSEIESGAFFKLDPSDDGRYMLRPEGFAYAMGLLLVDELRNAGAGDLFALTEATIDPIRGHDLVVEILLAALGIACADPQCSDELRASLVCAILAVQNLPDSCADSILAYATAAPAAFIAAAEMEWSGELPSHARSDWTGWFLASRRDDARVRPHVDAAIRKWLGIWHREPDRMPRHGLSGEQLEKEEARQKQLRDEFSERLASLAPEERRFLDGACTEVEGSRLKSIDTLAVQLMAGRPLEPFAEAIVAWHLAEALTYRIHHAGSELHWLMRLNPVDSSSAAAAIREQLGRLGSLQPSRTGLWTAIGTLRGLGRAVDAALAEELFAKVDTGERGRSWRRVEQFCDTDPIDPGSKEATNIAQAEQRVAAIEVFSLRKFMAMARDDHDLRDLTPALARFRPDAIVAKLRAYAADLGNRTGASARFVAFSLSEISALLGPSEVATLRDAYSKFVADPQWIADSEQRVAIQYLLLILLPHLSAEQQIDALVALPDEGGEMTSLREHFKPLHADELGLRLAAAERLNPVVLRRVLFFASWAKSALNAEARGVVGRAFKHENFVVRLLAFDVAAVTRDQELLTELARSDWNALDVKAGRTEDFYGSKALSLVPPELRTLDTFARMSMEWQARAADTWDDRCVAWHADVVLKQIRNALGLPPDLAPDVGVERNLDTPDRPTKYPYLSASDEPKKDDKIFDALRRLSSNSDEEWKAEQLRQKKAVDAYFKRLKEHKADRFLDYAYIAGFAAVARRLPAAFEEMVALFMNAKPEQLSFVGNALICAAVALSRFDAGAGAKLLSKVLGVRPHVQLTIGDAEINFSRLALWLLEDSPEATRLRNERIRTTADDAALFAEALSATDCKKQDQLLRIVEDLVVDDNPGVAARGLTLASFSDPNDLSARLLSDSRFENGFLGEVAKAARHSYERNVWARHWYDEARAAKNRVSWWRAIELMTSASDGRFVLWFKPERDFTPEFASFAEFARDRLSKRSKEKRDKRAKQLFGLSAPSDELLLAAGFEK